LEVRASLRRSTAWAHEEEEAPSMSEKNQQREATAKQKAKKKKATAKQKK
jgi:hypothetical protein